VALPVRVGCDVARFGSDETVIAVRKDPRVRIEKVLRGRDTMATVGELVRVAKACKDDGLDWPTIVVDDVGVGGGVTDRLQELRRDGSLGGTRVVGFNGGHTARASDDYPNRRSELWFEFADRIDELDLDEDEQLAADLVAPRYRLDSRGRRVVEAKDDTKKRLGRSPDRADGILLTFAVPDRRTSVPADDVEPERVDPLYQRRRARDAAEFPSVDSPL
jgi:phage terminase large subunit